MIISMKKLHINAPYHREDNIFMTCIHHHKYKNNYDYNLSIQLMNNRYYMTNESTLLVENDSFFSPISQLNYSFYVNKDSLVEKVKNHQEIQCIVGLDIPFGMAQQPGLGDYADGIDTLNFLIKL